MKLPHIDWDRISCAIDFYKGHGFEYVEVPWVSSTEVATSLLPSDKRSNRPFQLIGGMEMVGSGEVALVEMLHRGLLRDEAFYVTCTPCFRWERNVTNTYLPQFLKVELFHSGPWDAHDHLLEAAEQFFEREYIGTNRVDTDDGTDLEINGVEVGSYGYRHRHYNGLSWSYGTGLAEPRTSVVLRNT